MFLNGSHAGGGVFGVDLPDCQAAGEAHLADGCRYHGDAKAGFGPLDAGAGIGIFTEYIGADSGILEGQGYDGIEAAIID